MSVAVEIPDVLAEAIQSSSGDLTRGTVEALALEGYRSRRLTESQLVELLGFSTRIQVHGFLKSHGVFLNYDQEDLEADLRFARDGKF
jgi:predicted HTH domain antitoxin